MPYVTKVTTLLSVNAGPEVARSAKGHYSVYEGETITFSGFNLKNGDDEPTLKLGEEALTVTDSSINSVKATVTSGAKSGFVSITVNGVLNLNNSNANPTLVDGATNPNGGALYNSQANDTNNKRLTDDVYIYVWDMGFFRQSIKITDPVMKMDAEGNYYMVYDNNISGSAFQLVFDKNGKIYNIDGSYNKFHNNAVAVDTSGKAYGASTNTDRINNTSARFKYYSWSENTGIYGTSSYTSSSVGNSLEQVYNTTTGVYDINRVPTPKMFAFGDGKVYMSYFDSNHTQSPVKFRFGTGLTQTTSGTAQSDSNVTTSTGTAGYFHVLADNTMTYQGGKYSAVGATSSGVAVVAWYDASARRLIYSYNDAPGTPVYGGVWQTNAQVIDDNYAGQYVDLFVDSADGIHIAYYVNSTGDLKYAYLPSYDFKLNTSNRSQYVVTVDAYLSAGTNITINTKDEIVNDVTYIVPYIAYENASFIQTTSPLRVAWLPKTIKKSASSTVSAGAVGNFFTGSWEVVAVPTTNIPTDAIICSGVPTGDAKGLGHNGKSPVLGFMSDVGYEWAFIKY